MGIGFAIPIDMAKWVMEDLIYEGKVSRGWLGVKIQNLSAATREAFGLSDKFTGVLIADVFEGQPAARAGVKRGDVVVSINGVNVDDVNELRNTVASIDPGKSVPLVVMRDGKEIELSVRLGERDEESLEKGESAEEKDEGEDSEGGSAEGLGLTVKSITGEMRKQYGLDKNVKGVVITEVAPSSQAAQEGLKPGDVVKEVKVRGKRRVAVTSAKAFKRELKDVKEGDAVMFLLERDGGTFFVAFKVRK
jgi:serine protease Do